MNLASFYPYKCDYIAHLIQNRALFLQLPIRVSSLFRNSVSPHLLIIYKICIYLIYIIYIIKLFNYFIILYFIL